MGGLGRFRWEERVRERGGIGLGMVRDLVIRVKIWNTEVIL